MKERGEEIKKKKYPLQLSGPYKFSSCSASPFGEEIVDQREGGRETLSLSPAEEEHSVARDAGERNASLYLRHMDQPAGRSRLSSTPPNPLHASLFYRLNEAL